MTKATDRKHRTPGALDKPRGSVDTPPMLSTVESTTHTGLPIGQVVETYGVSFDQLRYWDRQGILVPGRVGSTRVYYREHLEKLATIQRLMSDGWTPLKVKLWLDLQGLRSPRSLSSTHALAAAVKIAKKGSIVRESLPSKTAYNSVYVRLRRKVEQAFPGKKVGRGKDVEIRLSEDERFLEAVFNR